VNSEERMNRFEKQLKATANLVRAGMKIVVADRQAIHALTDAHMRAEARMDRLERKFDRLIDILLRGSRNGRDGGR